MHAQPSPGGEAIRNMAEVTSDIPPSTGRRAPNLSASRPTRPGLPRAVVKPRQIRDFARVIGQLAKSDALDAEAVALLAERVRPEARSIAEPKAQALAGLVARRRQVGRDDRH